MRRVLALLLCASLLGACAPRAALRSEDPDQAHALAVRQAQQLGEAPPAMPSEPKPASFWRMLSYGSYAAAMLTAAGALAIAADDRGPDKTGAASMALFGLSGAFLGAGLSFTWYAHQRGGAR